MNRQKHPFIIISSILGQKNLRQQTKIQKSLINPKIEQNCWSDRSALKNRNKKAFFFYVKKQIKISNQDESLQKFEERIVQLLKLQKKDSKQIKRVSQRLHCQQMPILLKISQGFCIEPTSKEGNMSSYDFKTSKAQHENIIKGLNINDLSYKFAEQQKFKPKANTNRRNQSSDLKFINSKNGVKLGKMIKSINKDCDLQQKSQLDLIFDKLEYEKQSQNRYSQELSLKQQKRLNMVVSSRKGYPKTSVIIDANVDANINTKPNPESLEKDVHVSSMILQRRPKSSKKLGPLDISNKWYSRSHQQSKTKQSFFYEMRELRNFSRFKHKQNKNRHQNFFSPWKFESQFEQLQ